MNNLFADGLPYTTLSYANGPGYNAVFYSENGTRNDLTNTEFGMCLERNDVEGMHIVHDSNNCGRFYIWHLKHTQKYSPSH